MADTVFIALLVPRQSLPRNLNRLSHALKEMELNSDVSGDLASTDFNDILKTEVSSVELEENFERANGNPYQLELKVGNVPEGEYIYDSGTGYQQVLINFTVDDQRRLPDPASHTLIRLYYAYSGSKLVPSTANIPSMLLAQKIVEVLQPIYGFSTDESTIEEVETLSNPPWNSYANTMIFGKDLVEQLKLQDFISQPDNSIFYCKKLGDTYWLADPAGIGNEWPAKLSVGLGFENSRVELIEPGLDLFFKKVSLKHKNSLTALIRLSSNT